MLEKPNLHDETILACVRESYGLPVAGVEFLPVGNDSYAWVYRARTEDGASYFVKVKKGPVSKPSLIIPRHLKDSGIEQVVAPLRTTVHDLWTDVDGYTLILYPFVEGSVGMEVGLSDHQWMEFGAALRRVHSSRLSAELLEQVRRETFAPKWGGVVKELQRQINTTAYHDPIAQALASFWKEHSETIGRMVERAEKLGRALQHDSSVLVLCHADIHTANILLDQDQKLFMVDWDEALLAPIERDLMFVVGGAVGGAAVESQAEAWFFKGYGATPLDPAALAYYRYEWVVQEIGDFGERVLLMDGVGDETRADAVQGFRDLFQPGNVVEAASSSEAHLPPHLRVTRV